MLEVYVIVAKRCSLLKMLAFCLLVAVTVIAFILSLLRVPFMILAVVALMFCCYLAFFQLKIEYEYSYFDGEVRFAKVMNKSHRKNLRGFTMDEVILIAPMNDPKLTQYEKDTKIKRMDYTSHFYSEDVYTMVVSVPGEGTRLIFFEPNDKYLDAVSIKYAHKVSRSPNE